VDLAVDGEVVALGANQNRGVVGLLALSPSLGDAAGDEVDRELARPSPRRGQARPVERLGAGDEFLPSGQQVPLLRQGNEFGSVGGRRTDQALGRCQVPFLIPVGVELYRRCAHACPSLIDQSIGNRSI
jgi:hypothetical protein